MPRLTIIMPVLNGMPYLKDSVESLLGQSFKDFRLIIVNDGSTDNTDEYLCSLKDERLTIINNGVTKGVINSFNGALQLADTEYAARVDADDISHEHKFEKQIDFLDKNKDVVLAGTSAFHLSEDGRHKGWKVNMPEENNEIIRCLFNRHSVVIQPTAVIRTNILKKIGGYRENVYPEDYDLYFRLIEYGKLANIPAHLYFIRLHKKSITGQNIESLQQGYEKLRIYYMEYYQGLSNQASYQNNFSFLKNKKRSNKLALYFDVHSVVNYRKGLAACLNGNYLEGYAKLIASALLSPKRAFKYSRRFLGRAGLTIDD